MGLVVASAMTLSLTANTTSAEQVSGNLEFLGKGILRLYAKASAIGVNAQFKIQGMPVVDNMQIPMTGTTGTLSRQDNMLAETPINGGRCSLKFQNTTGGNLTVDYIVDFTPTK